MTTPERPGLRAKPPSPAPESVPGAVDRYFSLSTRGSTWRREIVAGASTFLALSYIVVVNPAVLGRAGIPHAAAFFATAAVGGLATMAMGLWARLPFAVAPGMEMNAMVAFSVVGTLAYTWPQALGMVFWSGIAMLAVSLLRLREAVINAIPPQMRSALAAAVGTFIGLVGLQIAHLVTTSHGRLSGLGDWTGPPAVSLYIGLTTALVLDALGARATAILCGIAAAAVYCALAGIRTQTLHDGIHGSGAALLRFDLTVVADPRAWSVVLVLFALDFFGSIAKVVGLSAHTPLQDGNGKVPGMRQALLVDAGATVAGSAVGSSSFVAFVESAVGIRAGARTGIAALVTGLLLLSCLFLGPLLAHIPVEATTGALVFVAVKMLTAPLPDRTNRPNRTNRQAPTDQPTPTGRPDPPDRLGPAVTATAVGVTLATLAIDQAMAAAFLVTTAAGLLGRRRPHPALWVTTTVLTASVLLQYLNL
ncbi:NCS2 family permease (plasmid) [Streptomyces sp. BHT-5-2]|uniref:NCS2 family permease n=1 Tax=Streptomyces sp. BHT-5-2 TaxID=2866715 RepID=UPI001C8D334B|nr:NCS2 family permease [Streptomyces sp. BHT-5-2]QZL08031.1 NCS2 family permease [Streptomyces sp. BHT-5-2]